VNFFVDKHVYFFNIALGDKFLNYAQGPNIFHVCRNTSDGYMFAVFHRVNRKDVIGENVFSADYMDDCITLVWTAPDFQDKHVDRALKYADEISKNIEFVTGCRFPIPLGELQHPTNFEVAECRVRDQVVDRVSLQHVRTGLPVISPKIVPQLGALMGFNDDFDKTLSIEPYKSMYIAGRWQQKAIRSHSAGEYSECVISCAIWSEIFLVSLSVELLRLVSEPILDVENALSRGLPQFLNRYLGSKFLKGNWDHKNKNTDVGMWYQNCYYMRNNIVHAGYIPSNYEAITCYETTHCFVKIVTRQTASLKDVRLKPVTEVLSAMHNEK
jgi:hypothetical protein